MQKNYTDNTIFVQIASYKDPQLIPTLFNMVDNAAHPELLDVAISWQHDDSETREVLLKDFELLDDYLDLDGFKVYTYTYKKVTFRFIDICYKKTKGACWARHLLQQLYNEHKYTLQLDSHHRFVPNWDTECIDMLESLRGESKKPVLTAYLPSFDPENDPQKRETHPWRMNFDRFIPEGAIFFMPASIDNFKDLDKPIKARFYSAHFAFADGHFAKVVQHDPNYFFHGEEISIAVRAFTHGYDLYHPHKIVAWHEYTRKGRVKMWDDHSTNFKNAGNTDKDWVERNNECHLRNRILFGMDGHDSKSVDFGEFGFGKERTLRQYEEYSGISFDFRGVHQSVIDKIDPPTTLKYKNKKQWASSFVTSNDIRILLNRNEITWNGTKYDGKEFAFWYVGCARSDLSEIYRKDASHHEIKEYFNNSGGEHVDFRLAWYGNEFPTHYVIWPVIKDEQNNHIWLDRIVKPVDQIPVVHITNKELVTRKTTRKPKKEK